MIATDASSALRVKKFFVSLTQMVSGVKEVDIKLILRLYGTKKPLD
jgi:hypothetical protein